ncbi:MAG: NAD-dependent epimerase/dehydratase family protein [Candidatus Sericytochromatia bacterium]|nr:NAD-dependent epimerase/dehydratase family protein [Candidatus Sericytochromatia bacterium]
MRALVTGAGGFIGGGIAEALVREGHRVTAFQRGDYPALSTLGVAVVRGDVADADAIARAAVGHDVVFHVAALAGAWGEPSAFRRVNVQGTEAVIAACRRAGVPRLVYTSSPSVVFDGRDMAGVDESVPYPDHHDAPYPATKAEAERAVLAANGAALATVALRPHLVWGPRDPHFLPRLVARRRSGRLRRIGDGRNLVDGTYIDNAVAAHLLAAERLAPGAGCAGKAYFIANGEPMPAWELVDALLEAAGEPAVVGAVPAWLAYGAGAVLEGLHGLLPLPGEPPMTRWVARELATTHWFDLGAARRELGYAPAVSTHEGLARLRAWVSAQRS